MTFRVRQRVSQRLCQREGKLTVPQLGQSVHAQLCGHSHRRLSRDGQGGRRSACRRHEPHEGSLSSGFRVTRGYPLFERNHRGFRASGNHPARHIADSRWAGPEGLREAAFRRHSDFRNQGYGRLKGCHRIRPFAVGQDTAGGYSTPDLECLFPRWACPSASVNPTCFLKCWKNCPERATPEKHALERGRLIDAYVDGHKYIFDKKAIVYGEEDLVIGLTAFLAEIGVRPVLCASGGRSGKFEQAIAEVRRRLAAGTTGSS